MQKPLGSRFIWILGAVFLGSWLIIRYLLPVVLPFLLGAGIAALAEKAVSRLCGKGMPRALASGLCVTGIYLLLSTGLYFLGVVVYRELGNLLRSLPELAAALSGPVEKIRVWAYGLTDRAPQDLRPLLESAVASLFRGASSLAARGAEALLTLVSGFLTHVPDGLLFLGTAVLSSFMISARYPRLKAAVRERLPAVLTGKLLPAVSGLRKALGGWLRAQARLMGLTFLILTAGFLILRVEFAVLFAALIALVDAVPMLGTGTVLIPWSILRFLDRDPAMAVGLLALYGVSMTTRTALEPRLVGKHMGLNPLLTLCALYAGYRLWGVLGVLVAPVLAICAVQIYGMTRPAPG